MGALVSLVGGRPCVWGCALSCGDFPDMPAPKVPGFQQLWECAVSDRILLAPFAAVAQLAVFCSYALGLDGGCPQDDWPFVLFFPMVIEYSVNICHLWPAACIGVVGFQHPSLTNWSINATFPLVPTQHDLTQHSTVWRFNYGYQGRGGTFFRTCLGGVPSIPCRYYYDNVRLLML